VDLERRVQADHRARCCGRHSCCTIRLGRKGLLVTEGPQLSHGVSTTALGAVRLEGALPGRAHLRISSTYHVKGMIT
jgi:hypothetical protein